MSKYTPESVDEVCEAWVVHAGHDLLTAVDLVEGREGFLSWLADRDAQVRAAAYEEARQGIAEAITASMLRFRDGERPSGTAWGYQKAKVEDTNTAWGWKPGDRP